MKPRSRQPLFEPETDYEGVPSTILRCSICNEKINVLRLFSILSMQHETSLLEALPLVVWICSVSETKESSSAVSSILATVHQYTIHVLIFLYRQRGINF
jgi:hypothetical protein